MSSVNEPRRERTAGPSLITVGGGETVSVWQYGGSNGRPVMAFHGVPSCGAGFAWANEPALERGVRLIAPDRPGVGWSSPSSGRRVGDYPATVDALADALGLDSYSVLGYSGGGPYAVACHARATGRVTAAAICAGISQIGDGWAKGDEFEKTDAQMLDLAVRRPRRARFMMAVAARGAKLSPKGAMNAVLQQMSSTDREVFAQLGTARESMRLFTEAFSQGAAGVVADYAALAQPWGFDVRPKEIPLSVWHGDDDPSVPLAHSQMLATRLAAPLTIWPGEGHFGLITHIGDVLDWIVDRT